VRASLGGANVPVISKSIIRALRIDNFAGMVASEIATWSIIVLCAATLNAHGIMTIHTSADAAKALYPLVKTFPHAGFLAELIFSIGRLSFVCCCRSVQVECRPQPKTYARTWLLWRHHHRNTHWPHH
jgi:hypothetical protein